VLPGAILAYLWARDRGNTWAWLLPGALLGLMCLIRPEYMFVAIVLIALALATIWRKRDLRSAIAPTAVLALSCALVILPWTIRNFVVLDRVVPISTGSGKALYVGTSLPNDGEYFRVKASLVERFQGRTLDPDSEALDEVDPTPLFNRVAAEHPELSRDAALSKIGKEQFFDYLGEDPVGYAGMTVRKVWRMWSSGVGEAMSSTAGRIIQVILVCLGLAGLILLAFRRRYEALVLAVPIVVVTGIAAITLAPPRRNEILMTLILPLAAAAIVAGLGRMRDLSSSGP
jgi:4-amino-4-deoxy-L-arabinose transferase-like glycosyltransferase